MQRHRLARCRSEGRVLLRAERAPALARSLGGDAPRERSPLSNCGGFLKFHFRESPPELGPRSSISVKISASSAFDSVVLDRTAELIFVSLVLRVVVLVELRGPGSDGGSLYR
ncbi:hypothetical protein AAFF_G00019100 [Aldrovandia affinis]|uniref:Uncharacterized protein n=1 Tax=Aldrovandia affinis TaxID=143900 RepID=A0AAD7S5R6_9TELE|nr:hypothetical protein AAFF_G00019100 [Aldrovandia affinis]